MAGQPTHFDDGDWTNGFYPGFNAFSFPFGNNPTPDTYCRITDSALAITPICYTPNIGTTRIYENLILWSEQFDNAAWTKENVTVTANSALGPTGVDADLMVETTATGAHRMYQSFAVSNAVPHTFSVCVKPMSSLGRNYCYLVGLDSASTTFQAVFDLVSGVVVAGSVSNCTAAIMNVGHEYFRIMITATPAVGTCFMSLYASVTGTTPTYAGSTAYGLAVFGAQVESLLDASSANRPGAYLTTTNTTNQSSLPFADGTVDPFAFLVGEAPMQLTEIQKASIRQTYARIPADQIYPASRVVVRPVMNDIYNGTNYYVSFDNGVTSTRFPSRQATTGSGTDIPPSVPVNVITSRPAGTLQSLPADVISIQDVGAHGTTFTLTTAPSTLQGALSSALTSLGNISVVGTANSLSISWDTGTLNYVSSSTTAQISSTTNNVTFTTAQSAANVTQNTAWQYIPNTPPSLRTIGATNHGGNVGDQVAIWNGTKLSCISRLVLTAANSFSIPLSDLPGNDIVVTNCAFAKDGTRYVNGPKECVVKKTQKFYLPGVTSNVNSFAQIPTYAPETDPIKWAAAIDNSNSYAVESVSDLTQWYGKILVQELNQVQMSDALVTVTAGA